MARVGILVLCLILEKMLSSSLLNIMLAKVSYIAFIMLRYVPSMPTFWSFYYKWVLNFVRRFFCLH